MKAFELSTIRERRKPEDHLKVTIKLEDDQHIVSVIPSPTAELMWFEIVIATPVVPS